MPRISCKNNNQGHNFQLSPDWISAELEENGIRISHANWEILPQMEESYVFFLSDGRTNQIRISSVLPFSSPPSQWPADAKFFIYQSIHVPTLTYGHEL